MVRIPLEDLPRVIDHASRGARDRRTNDDNVVADADRIDLGDERESEQVVLDQGQELVGRVILAFEVFATVIAIAGEGTTVLAAEAYRWENTNQDEHVAAAYATLILVLSVVSAIGILRFLRTRKEQLFR